MIAVTDAKSTAQVRGAARRGAGAARALWPGPARAARTPPRPPAPHPHTTKLTSRPPSHYTSAAPPQIAAVKKFMSDGYAKFAAANPTVAAGMTHT
jgi:hypothetical protein